MNEDAMLDIAALRVAYPDVPASTIRRWASEGRLDRQGADRQGRTLYRLGDVMDLAARRSGSGRS